MANFYRSFISLFAVNTSSSVALTSASISNTLPSQFHLHPDSAPLLQIQTNWDVSRSEKGHSVQDCYSFKTNWDVSRAAKGHSLQRCYRFKPIGM